jgi:hypothetical protein
MTQGVRYKDKYILCHGCDKPVARVHDDVLIIEVRHNGLRHTTIIPLDKLIKSR